MFKSCKIVAKILFCSLLFPALAQADHCPPEHERTSLELCDTYSFATDQESCPTHYSEEQINLIGHSAYITVAARYCPNLKASAKPLFVFMAAAWGTLPNPDELKCQIWKDAFNEATGRAASQIAAHGLKRFCENSVGLYGPNGSLVTNALTFSTEPSHPGDAQ